MKMTKPQATMMTTKMKMSKATPTQLSSLRSRISAPMTAAALLLAGLGSFAGSAAPGQHKGPTVRLIQGLVTDKDDKPLPNAVVYLKDEKTLQVKSYLTDDQGHFRFGQLSMATDYDVWADHGGTHSKTKTISSFNSKPTVDYTLKIDK